MIGEVGQGGLKMPDLFIMKKIQRILTIKQLLFSNFQHPWKNLVLDNFKKVGGSLLFQCNFSKKSLPVTCTQFITECLDAWSEVNQITRDDDQLIWNSKNILLGGKSIFYNKFNEVGIHFVSDLFHGQTKIQWETLKGKV